MKAELWTYFNVRRGNLVILIALEAFQGQKDGR
jgi:hypothetical protein